MDSIKNIINYFHEKIKPLTTDSFKFIEQQRNIFYFSKFSIDIEEFKEIYIIIRSIKENTFRELREKIKVTIDSALLFLDNNLTEKDKVMVLFSVCYLHYYSCFSYDVANSFASFYNDEFYTLCEKFRFVIKKHELFKAFCFEFYNEIQTQIKKVNYEKVKKMFQYYNFSIIEEQKTAFISSNNNPIEMLQEHLNKNNALQLHCFLKKSKFLTHLLAAKERMIDMVLENRTKRMFSDTNMQNSINDLMDQIHTISKQTYGNSSKECPFEEKCNDKCKEMQVDEDYEMNTLPTDTNNSIYSKRVLSELIKCEINDETRVQINEISQKVDELFLDVLLNQGKKNTNIINPFVCYIIEINSAIIKLIPEYSNLNDDLILRFIVPAKNIYNNFFEMYFSIYDLKHAGIETVGNILTKRNQLRFATCVYSFFKSFTNEMFKKKSNVIEKMDDVLENFFNEQFKVWESTIKEKGQELTHFCLV